MKAEAVLWSRGALGRVPCLDQRRVILFFWPTRAFVGEPEFYGFKLDALFASDLFQAARF
jgi:hypothetical protein